MNPKRKNLTTELKDLDVDRVDGVDRPATGRAFALFKSAEPKIITLKSMADVRALAHDIAKGVVNMSGIRVFINDVEQEPDAVERLLTSMAGDGSRSEQMFSPAGNTAFNASASIVDRPASDVPMVEPLADYDYQEPDPWKRVGMSFMPAGDPNIARPGQYTAPAPGSMAQVDAPQPADQMRDPMTGRVLPVKKGTFAGTDADMFAPVAKALTSVQKNRAALPTILKNAYATLIFRAAQGGYVVRCEGEVSPIFPTVEKAQAFLKSEICKAMNLNPDDDDMETHLNAGTASSLADASINAAGVPIADPKARERIARAQKNVRLI